MKTFREWLELREGQRIVSINLTRGEDQPSNMLFRMKSGKKKGKKKKKR